MKRYGKNGIVSSNKIVKHKIRKNSYSSEYNYREDQQFKDIYCMECNCHGCKVPCEGPVAPRTKKALKKNKFFQRKDKYNNKINIDFYL